MSRTEYAQFVPGFDYRRTCPEYAESPADGPSATQPGTSSRAAPTGSSSVAAPTAQSTAARPATTTSDRPALDVHAADLTDVSVPAPACAADQDFAPDGGFRWEGTEATSTTSGKPIYGDLDGDGNDEAALDFLCQPDGGRLVVDQGYVIVSRTSGVLAVVGVVSSQHRPDGQPGVVDSVTFGANEITTTEQWFQAQDPMCCPSGRATTVWTYDGGQLTPGEPQVR